MKLYSMFDVKANRFAPPFLAVSDDYARRMLVLTYHNLGPDSPLHVYPNDFTLFGIADFDEDTAGITSFDALENLGTMQQILASCARPQASVDADAPRNTEEVAHE